MESVSWLDHSYVAALTIAFLFAILKSQPKIANQSLTTSEKLTLYWSNSAFLYLIAAAGLGIWFFHDRPFESLGICWPHSENLLAYSGLTVAFLAWFLWDFFSNLGKSKRAATSQRWRTLTPFMPENKAELPHGIHLGIAAGISEEIVFRGFFINYFALLLDGRNLFDIPGPLSSLGIVAAIAIPALMFAAAHRYHGWSGVFKIFWLASVFGLIFVLSGSLLIVIALHIFVDTVANLYSPKIMSWTAAPDNPPALQNT